MFKVLKKSKKLLAVLLTALLLTLCAPLAFAADEPHTHTLTKTEAVAATCTKSGNNAYWTCSGCGKFFSDEAGATEIAKDSWVIAALGHEQADDKGECPRCHEQIQNTPAAAISDLTSGVSDAFSEITEKAPFLVPFFKWFIRLFVYVLSI